MVKSTPDASETVRRTAHSGAGGARILSSRTLLLASALPALAGMLLVLTITARSGPGVTPDSVAYLSAARSLLDGEGFRAPDGEPYVSFPPLFPALIAAASLGVFDLTAAATALVAVSFGVTILVTGWTAGRTTGSSIAALIAALAVLLSTPVLDAALHIWSELPFMAFTMLCLGALALPNTRSPGRSSATATIAAALATLTRYIGVTLTLTHVLTVLTRPGTAKVARLRGAAMALLGLIPLLLWLVRNQLVSGTPTGERYPAVVSFDENARAAIESLLGWLVPIDAPMRFRALLVLLLVVALLAILLPSIRDASRARRLLWTCLPFAGFCTLYLIYLILAASITALDPIDNRLIAPLLPAAIVLTITLIAVAATSSERWRTAGQIGALALLCLWLVASAPNTVRLVQRATSDGIAGYADSTWQRSQTLAYLQAQLPSAVIYSNDPFAITYHTDRQARLSPRTHPYRSPNATVDDITDLRAALASGDDVYLVWFDAVPRDFLLSPAELAMILEVEPVARFDDGAVYRLR